MSFKIDKYRNYWVLINAFWIRLRFVKYRFVRYWFRFLSRPWINTDILVNILFISKTSSRRLQCNNFLSSKTSSRHLEDVLQKRLEDVFKTYLQDVFKTSWKKKNCYAKDVFKTSWRPANVCWVLSKNDILKTSIS